MTSLAAPAPTRGVEGWLRGFRLMLRWTLTDLRLVVPVLTAGQLLTGVGFVLGMGLLVPDLDGVAATYLVAGVAAITVVLLGLAIAPQLVAEQKLRDTYDFEFSLPVPRSATATAWFVVNLAVAVPTAVVTLLAGLWRYEIDLDVTWSVVPAVVVSVFTATLLGYALGHAIPQPMLTQVISMMLIFGILGFSPIIFPAERLPSWLATLHEWLPFESLAAVIRGSLAPDLVGSLERSYVVLGVWAAVSLAVAVWVVGRRR